MAGKKGKIRALSGRDRTGRKIACRASSIALISSPDLTLTSVGTTGQDRLLRIELDPGKHRLELFPLSHWNSPLSLQLLTDAFQQDNAITTTSKQV